MTHATHLRSTPLRRRPEAGGAALLALALAACGGEPLDTGDPTPAASQDALPPELGRSDFVPVGDVTETANGYRVVGELLMKAGEEDQVFEDADLELEFDDEGQLVYIEGEADLPVNLTPHITAEAGARAVVGMMTGQQVADDPEIDIDLIAERRYLVFFLRAGLDLTIRSSEDPDEAETVTLDVPTDGEILLVLDPHDPMLYRFAGTDLLAAVGMGQSYQGLFPFVPNLEFAELDTFRGHTLEKGSMGLGVKIFDFFEIEGARVVKEPQFRDIDWEDPFASSVEFRAGFNGWADFSFAILGVGLFEFELAETSATMDVGIDRQHLGMVLSLAPDSSWVPAWFHLQPAGAARGRAFIDGNGEYSFQIDGDWRSELPAADVKGAITLENRGATLMGSTVQGSEELAVSMTFRDGATIGRVEFPPSYAASIESIVTEAVDRELAEVEAKIAELEAAAANYELEVSLRGLRAALPAMMDEAVATLDEIPGTVYARARSRALSAMRSRCKKVVTRSVCLDDIVDEDDIASSVARTARSEAREGIEAPRAAMVELKRRALEEDDETLRDALAEAHEHRRFSRRVRVRRKFGWPFDETFTLYDETYEKDVLTSARASRIAEARDNAHRIQETSDLRIEAQRVVDALPTEAVLNEVRREVERGLATIPTVEGLGYEARDDAYSGFVTVDGEDRPLEINVLRPSEVKAGVGDLLADLLVGDR